MKRVVLFGIMIMLLQWMQCKRGTKTREGTAGADTAPVYREYRD